MARATYAEAQTERARLAALAQFSGSTIKVVAHTDAGFALEVSPDPLKQPGCSSRIVQVGAPPASSDVLSSNRF